MGKAAKSSEVLTSSPYKNALEKQSKEKAEKLKKAEERKSKKMLNFNNAKVSFSYSISVLL